MKQPRPSYYGHLFEQFVGLELVRMRRGASRSIEIRCWRDPDGPEVDWVIDMPEEKIPIEVKWTDRPQDRDARHLKTFLNEYPEAKHRLDCSSLRR